MNGFGSTSWPTSEISCHQQGDFLSGLTIIALIATIIYIYIYNTQNYRGLRLSDIKFISMVYFMLIYYNFQESSVCHMLVNE